MTFDPVYEYERTLRKLSVSNYVVSFLLLYLVSKRTVSGGIFEK
jgi:hypothetical protein